MLLRAMEPLTEWSRRELRRRGRTIAVWATTAGAFVCSVLIFLATNPPSPAPVADQQPSPDWQLSVTPTTVRTSTSEIALPAVTPSRTTSTAPSTTPVVVTRTRSSSTAPPPDTTTTTPPPAPAITELRALAAGKCLDVPNSTTTQGTQLQIYTCNGRPNQAWTNTPAAQLTVTLDGTTRCLDANAQGTAPGTKVIIWPCNDQTNQQWWLRPDGTVVGVQSGLCLDVVNSSTANTARTQLSTCDGRSSEQWALT
jgi:hypothetical protein